MKKRSFTLTELIVIIGVITLLMFILLPALKRARDNRIRAVCANNLSQIGKAMFIYTDDWDDDYPRVAGPDSTWGPTSNFQAGIAAEAYGLNDGPGQASISANFYLLIKYAEVTPKSLLCKGDKKTTEFTLAKYKIRNQELCDLWDFGPDPSKHCSYSYHIPYGPYPLTTSIDPGFAIAADRNPWLDSPGYIARPPSDLAAFNPNGSSKARKQANSLIHQQDGLKRTVHGWPRPIRYNPRLRSQMRQHLHLTQRPRHPKRNTPNPQIPTRRPQRLTTTPRPAERNRPIKCPECGRENPGVCHCEA